MFDPHNFDYTEYILETYNLTEMPLKKDNSAFVLDDDVLNGKEAIRIERRGKFVDKYKAGEQAYRLFFEKETDGGTYYLLYSDKPFITVEYSYENIVKPIKGIENKSIWNHRWSKGLARYFFENFVLQKEPVVISDKVLTDRGFKFWKNVFDEIGNKTHKMYVVDVKTEVVVQWIEDTKDMDKYFGDKMSRFRFVLERKK